MPLDDTVKKFENIDVDSLKPGMLVDRALYLYLEGNDRYIRMVKPLHPLEDRIYVKFRRLGKVFCTEPGIDQRFPDLQKTAEQVRVLCDDMAMSPFEKNRLLRSATEWLVPFVLKKGADAMLALFFMHRAFEVPKTETLLFVSDVSVEMYERCLKVATLSGILALWLGYSRTAFITQLVDTIFCEEIGLYANEHLGSLKSNLADRTLRDSHLAYSLELIKSGQVPGVEKLDYRFRSHLEQRLQGQVAGDEIYEIVEYARWALGEMNDFDEKIASARISKKLGKIFNNNENQSNEAKVAA